MPRHGSPPDHLEIGIFFLERCIVGKCSSMPPSSHSSVTEAEPTSCRGSHKPRKLTAEQSGTGGGGRGPHLPSGRLHFPALCSPPPGFHRFPLLSRQMGGLPLCRSPVDSTSHTAMRFLARPLFFFKCLQCFDSNTSWHLDVSASHCNCRKHLRGRLILVPCDLCVAS